MSLSYNDTTLDKVIYNGAEVYSSWTPPNSWTGQMQGITLESGETSSGVAYDNGRFVCVSQSGTKNW